MKQRLTTVNDWIGRMPELRIFEGGGTDETVFSRGLANEYRALLVAELLRSVVKEFGPEFDCATLGKLGFPRFDSSGSNPFSDAVLVYFVDKKTSTENPFLLGGSVPKSYFYKGPRWSNERLMRRFYVGFNLLKAALQHKGSPLDRFFEAFPDSAEIIIKCVMEPNSGSQHIEASEVDGVVTVVLRPRATGEASPEASLWDAVHAVRKRVEGQDVHPEVIDNRTRELLENTAKCLPFAKVTTSLTHTAPYNWAPLFGLCAYYDWPFEIRLFPAGKARVVVTHAITEPPDVDVRLKLRRTVQDLSNIWRDLSDNTRKAAQLFRSRDHGYLSPFREAYRNEYRGKLKLAGGLFKKAIQQATDGYQWAATGAGVLEMKCREKDLESLCDRLADHLRDPRRALKDKFKAVDKTPGAVLAIANDDLGDLVGVRVVVQTEVEVLRVASLLLLMPLAINGEKVHPDPERLKGLQRRDTNIWKTGYRSVHLQYLIDGQKWGLPLPGLRVEVQIRSLLAHVWSELEHDVRYKGGVALEELVKEWSDKSRPPQVYELGEDASAVVTGFVATAHGLHQQDREFRHLALAYERLAARYGPALGRTV